MGIRCVALAVLFLTAKMSASADTNISVAARAPDASASRQPARSKNPLRYFKFTNELGQAVSLSDFDGQAIAMTFFFTRCPIPQYCPRLSRNFEEVQLRLKARENTPANWRLISVSIDPENDTPEVLKQYAARYHYDPAHWTFLTGPKEKIKELARLSDAKFESDNGSITHNFRTLIIDSSNRLQMVFPISGDLSGSITEELLKALGVANNVTNISGTGQWSRSSH